MTTPQCSEKSPTTLPKNEAIVGGGGALTLLSGSRLPKPTNLDRIAWALSVRQYSDDDICSRLRIDVDRLALSKLRMQAHIASVSHDVVDMVVNEEILSVARSGGIKKALRGAMAADRVLVTRSGVVMDPITNEPLTVPDHDMRLAAVRTLSTLTKNLRPTSPMVSLNAQFNNNNTQNNLIGSGRSFEARRRAAAERRGVVPVAESEVLQENAAPMYEDEDEPELDDPDFVDETGDDEEEE